MWACGLCFGALYGIHWHVSDCDTCHISLHYELGFVKGWYQKTGQPIASRPIVVPLPSPNVTPQHITSPLLHPAARHPAIAIQRSTMPLQYRTRLCLAIAGPYVTPPRLYIALLDNTAPGLCNTKQDRTSPLPNINPQDFAFAARDFTIPLHYVAKLYSTFALHHFTTPLPYETRPDLTKPHLHQTTRHLCWTIPHVAAPRLHIASPDHTMPLRHATAPNSAFTLRHFTARYSAIASPNVATQYHHLTEHRRTRLSLCLTKQYGT